MFKLAPSAADAGYRLNVHDSVSSTNALALDLAREGDQGKLWIISKHQTGGRGRRGRAWDTPMGNLAATVLLSDLTLSPQIATLGFVAGLSLSDALNAVVPGGGISVGLDGASNGRNRFELKWPNDVLASGAKLSGILLESVVLSGGEVGLAIGIGVNVISYPKDVPYPATCLKELGADVNAEGLFSALSAAWVENYLLWDEGRGVSAIREHWLSRAAGLGSRVAIRVDGRVASGVFETIDEDCRFVIREDDGKLTHITAGDVHFGAVSSVRE